MPQYIPLQPTLEVETPWTILSSSNSTHSSRYLNDAVHASPKTHQRHPGYLPLTVGPSNAPARKDGKIRWKWIALALAAITLLGIGLSSHQPTRSRIQKMGESVAQGLAGHLECRPSPSRTLPRPPFRPRVIPDIAIYDRRIRVLHYIDFVTHDSLMDRWFQRSHANFAKRNDIVEDAPLWGPGFPDYADHISLTDNIIRKYGSPDYFDAVLPYFNTDQIEFRKLDPTTFFNDLKDLSQYGTVIIDRPHEMRDCRRCEMMDKSNVSLVLCPYANECFSHKDQYERKALLVHQPHPVDAKLFKYPILSQDGKPVNRSRDVFLAGCQEPLLYPLRDRLRWMIDDGELKGEVYEHPGYPDTFSDEEKQTWDVREDTMNQQLIDFGKELGDSKICLVTSSRWGYAIQKYGEASAAGCLIVGNIPFERQDDFREFVVEIKMSQTDKEIRRTVKYWLSHEEERLEKTQKAQQYFLNNFSGDRYVDDVVHWIKMAQRGQRGLVLPHQWSELPDPLPFDG